MSLDSQLQRTVGTVYGEIMRDSGISLPNGRYVSGREFASELIGSGAVTRAMRQQILRDIVNAHGYGEVDNILTGVQSVNKIGIGYTDYFVSNVKYTFNPWKEIMNGNSLSVPSSLDRNRIFESLRHNPREGVKKIKELYVE